MNSNNFSVSTPSSSKRKRTSSPNFLENATKKQPISNDVAEELKAQVDSQRADKYKLAKIANKQITETIILNSNVTEVMKICYAGLENASNVKTECSKMIPSGTPENVPNQFLNAAYKLRAEGNKTQILSTALNHVLAACNKSSEALRAARIKDIKKDAHPEHNRRSVATSSKPDAKWLKVKKKIRFSSQVQTSNPNMANVESDHDKIEITVPMNNGNNQFVNNTLQITIENKRSKKDLQKFRAKMSKEVVDFSTFQISQDSVAETEQIILSPTRYDESLNFNDTDKEIQLELSTVESDISDSVPKDIKEQVIKCEQFNFYNPTQAWINMSESEKRKIDLEAVDATIYFEKIVQKEVVKVINEQSSSNK